MRGLAFLLFMLVTPTTAQTLDQRAISRLRMRSGSVFPQWCFLARMRFSNDRFWHIPAV